MKYLDKLKELAKKHPKKVKIGALILLGIAIGIYFF